MNLNAQIPAWFTRMRPRKDAGVRANWRTRACAALIVLAATAIALPAQTFRSLHSFSGVDGATPYDTLVLATDGNLYGTTSSGGANNDSGCVNGCGAVFKITPSGSLTLLYSFCSQSNCTDGDQPYAGLVQGTDGNLYGTTLEGSVSGNGTVFKITTSGTLTTLYSFCLLSNCTDGAFPYAGLTLATDGNFYGATSAGGGITDAGTVFKITPGGTLTTLYAFCYLGCTGGYAPVDAPVEGTDGNFYGTTVTGGTYGYGTVFKITPSGTLTTLYNFCAQNDCADGEYPYAGLIQATDGNFYGTTEAGGAGQGGTIFKISASGELTTLYNFCSESGCVDGGNPYSPLIQAKDGNFYGTTYWGGAYSAGAVFKITPGGAFTVLHSFDTTDGENPNGALVEAAPGTFYGTTSGGGTGVCAGGYIGCGTVFSLSVGSSGSPLSLGLHFDFDGSGTGTDYTIWRPSSGTWYVLPTNGGTSIETQWGKSGDIVVPGDYDGDGITDHAVWRPSDGTWYVILSSTGKSVSYAWGESTDVPVPGDYDGDGKTDYAMWRPSTGTWWVVYSSTGRTVSQQWGLSTDLPVLGDFDGDGKTDYAVWRPSDGTWYVILSSTGQHVSQQWGLSTDIPVTGDYDGDGRTDYAIWRPSSGTWYVIYSSTGQHVSQAFGLSTDIAVARDYDGDNKTDYAIWRPSTGTWWVIFSSTGKTVTTQWGLSTDVPVNKPTGE
jgi:uncharacterized repeat protein (TIGR03803 family)